MRPLAKNEEEVGSVRTEQKAGNSHEERGEGNRLGK